MDLDNVTSLNVLMTEGTFKSFESSGSISTSHSSVFFNLLVMNVNVRSTAFVITTKAGLSLTPVKSVNGNGTKTMSPFFICNSLYNH